LTELAVLRRMREGSAMGIDDLRLCEYSWLYEWGVLDSRPYDLYTYLDHHEVDELASGQTSVRTCIPESHRRGPPSAAMTQCAQSCPHYQGPSFNSRCTALFLLSHDNHMAALTIAKVTPSPPHTPNRQHRQHSPAQQADKLGLTLLRNAPGCSTRPASA
jgi:hypothetical protein